LALVGLPLGAQARTVAREAELRDTPTGPVVAKLMAGTTVTRQEARAGHTRVIVEGFVEGAQLGGRKGRYQVHVVPTAGTALRASAEGAATAVAQLKGGVGLAVVVRSGKWVKVRRGGWVANTAFGESAPAATAATKPGSTPTVKAATAAAGTAAVAAAAGKPTGKPQPAAPAPAAPVAPQSAPLVASAAQDAPPLPDGALVTTRPSEVRTAPDGGATMGTTAKDAMLTPLARERGWVRVRIEGWVREGDVAPADTNARSALSAADLRADPTGSRGRVVRWEVEVISYQLADPLRKDLTPDEPYLLARGPGRENALLYLAVPPSLMAQAKGLPPLSTIIITARVRTGRSDPTGVPVLDIQQMARK
jgi:hypothetical protein